MFLYAFCVNVYILVKHVRLFSGCFQCKCVTFCETCLFCVLVCVRANEICPVQMCVDKYVHWFTGPASGAGSLPDGYQGDNSGASASAGRGQPDGAVGEIPEAGIGPQSTGGRKTAEVGQPWGGVGWGL